MVEGPAEQETTLAARDLGRRYPGGGGVEGLTLSAGPGTVIGVVGPNGAGKSTALALLAARLRPAAGHLFVRGGDVTRSPRAARRRIGYLGHQPPLYDDLRVRDLLRHSAILFGIPRRALDEAVSRALARGDLEAVAHRRVRHLSQGYARRVGLAQALVHDPAVLVLDEPTAGLDSEAAAGLIERLHALAGDRVTLLASHVFSEIDSICDRVLVLHNARVAALRALPGRRHGNEEALVVRIRDGGGRPPSPGALGLPGARSLAGGRFALPAPSDDDRRRLLARVLERGWSLDEWRPRGGLTEQIYRDVTEAR